MPAPSFATDPQVMPLRRILDEIANGYLLVPRFQRPAIWTDEQRLELMRSIHQGTPIGSILVWRTKQQVSFYTELGPYRLQTHDTSELISYVLDGHQRLSTLFGALKTSTGMRKTETSRPDDDTCWEIVYDLRLKDFFLANDIAKEGLTISLRVLLDDVENFNFRSKLTDEKDAEELVRRLGQLTYAFQDYRIPVVPIVTDSLEQVALTFQRVNSQGTKMSQVHMIHALTWSEDFDLNSQIRELREEKLADLGWIDIDDQLILTSCKATLDLDIFEGDIDVISRKFREESNTLRESVEHLRQGIRFLGTHCGITSPKLLPFTPLLPLLADGLRRADPIDKDLETHFVRWFWWTVYVGFGGGSNASRVRKAAESVKLIAQRERSIHEILTSVAEIAPPPRRFDFRHARAKVLALRMAEHHDRQTGSSDATKDLNLRGAEMIHPLVLRADLRLHNMDISDRLESYLRGPANRVIVSSEDVITLRRDLISGCLSEAARKAHLIPDHPIDDVVLLLEERHKALEKLDEEFAVWLGILSASSP